MTRATAIGIVMAITLVAPSARADGWYGGLGMGAEAGIEGELSRRYHTDGHIAGRITSGKRMGAFAIEGVFFGTDLSKREQAGTASTFSLGIDAKAFVPLGSGVEGYGRLGLSHTWLEGFSGGAEDSAYDGRSYEWGFGLQYVWRGPILAIGAWADFNRQTILLQDETGGPSMNGRLTMLTFGLSFGRAL